MLLTVQQNAFRLQGGRPAAAMPALLRRALRRWRQDAFRLAENERSVRADATGWRLAARSMVVLNLLGSLLMRDTYLGELLTQPLHPPPTLGGRMCLLGGHGPKQLLLSRCPPARLAEPFLHVGLGLLTGQGRPKLSPKTSPQPESLLPPPHHLPPHSATCPGLVICRGSRGHCAAGSAAAAAIRALAGADHCSGPPATLVRHCPDW